MALLIDYNEVEKFLDNVPYLLQSTRLKRGLSMRAAAIQMGLSPTIVEQLEKEQRGSHISTLRKIAKWMNSSND